MATVLRSCYVYIISNKNRTTFYVGVTNDIERRIFEHRTGTNDSFSKKHRLRHLVYIEEYVSINEAIARKKQLKRWHRPWKLNLIR